MNDTVLNNATLELTQKIQLHFPRDISLAAMQFWNGQPKEILTAKLFEMFGRISEMSVSEYVSQSQSQLLPLLIPVGTVSIAATAISFVTKDRFVVDAKKELAVKISYLGDNFKAWFIDKTEAPFMGSTLRYGKLSRQSLAGPIIDALGGGAKAETSLTELFALMELQPNGGSGSLLINGHANIF
jgi:hypothetical protein